MLVVFDYDVIAKANTTAVRVDGASEITREPLLGNRKYFCLKNVSE